MLFCIISPRSDGHLAFYSCKRLEKLSLARNAISDVGDTLFDACNRSLTHLSLSGNKLKSIGAWMNNLLSIQYLDLSKNELTEFPKFSDSSLRNLQVLKLNDNKLNRLHYGIGQLQNLIELDLAGNQFTSLDSLLLPIPAGSKAAPPPLCPSLTILTLSDNFISSFSAIPPFQTLSELYLIGNCIQNIPTNIYSRYPLLEYVNLQKNALGLPSALADSAVHAQLRAIVLGESVPHRPQSSDIPRDVAWKPQQPLNTYNRPARRTAAKFTATADQGGIPGSEYDVTANKDQGSSAAWDTSQIHAIVLHYVESYLEFSEELLAGFKKCEFLSEMDVLQNNIFTFVWDPVANNVSRERFVEMVAEQPLFAAFASYLRLFVTDKMTAQDSAKSLDASLLNLDKGLQETFSHSLASNQLTEAELHLFFQDLKSGTVANNKQERLPRQDSKEQEVVRDTSALDIGKVCAALQEIVHQTVRHRLALSLPSVEILDGARVRPALSSKDVTGEKEVSTALLKKNGSDQDNHAGLYKEKFRTELRRKMEIEWNVKLPTKAVETSRNAANAPSEVVSKLAHDSAVLEDVPAGPKHTPKLPAHERLFARSKVSNTPQKDTSKTPTAGDARIQGVETDTAAVEGATGPESVIAKARKLYGIVDEGEAEESKVGDAKSEETRDTKLHGGVVGDAAAKAGGNTSVSSNGDEGEGDTHEFREGTFVPIEQFEKQVLKFDVSQFDPSKLMAASSGASKDTLASMVAAPAPAGQEQVSGDASTSTDPLLQLPTPAAFRNRLHTFRQKMQTMTNVAMDTIDKSMQQVAEEHAGTVPALGVSNTASSTSPAHLSAHLSAAAAHGLPPYPSRMSASLISTSVSSISPATFNPLATELPRPSSAIRHRAIEGNAGSLSLNASLDASLDASLNASSIGLEHPASSRPTSSTSSRPSSTGSGAKPKSRPLSAYSISSQFSDTLEIATGDSSIDKKLLWAHSALARPEIPKKDSLAAASSSNGTSGDSDARLATIATTASTATSATTIDSEKEVAKPMASAAKKPSSVTGSGRSFLRKSLHHAMAVDAETQGLPTPNDDFSHVPEGKHSEEAKRPTSSRVTEKVYIDDQQRDKDALLETIRENELPITDILMEASKRTEKLTRISLDNIGVIEKMFVDNTASDVTGASNDLESAFSSSTANLLQVLRDDEDTNPLPKPSSKDLPPDIKKSVYFRPRK